MKKNRLLILPMIFVMLFVLTASLVGAEDVTTLTIVLPGERPLEMDKVASAMATEAAKEIGPVKLNFQFFGFEDYRQQLALKASSGESLDLIFDPNWLSFYDMQAQGAFLPINKYIKNLSFFGKPGNVPNAVWKQVSVGGQIYGLPAIQNAMVFGDNRAQIVRADLVKKYAPKGIKTGPELLEFAKLLKQKEPQYLMFAQGLDSSADMASSRPDAGWLYNKPCVRLSPWAPVGDNDLNLYVDCSKPSGKTAPKIFGAAFTKQWENDEWAQAQIRKLGLWSNEIIQDKRAAFKAGRAAFIGGDWSDYALAIGPSVKDSFGAIWLQINSQKGYLQRATGNWLSVGSKSKNPEKACAFANWIVDNRDHYEMWAYGIKGEHFKINDKGAVEKIDPEKRRYEMMWWYIFDEKTNLRQDFSDYPDVVAYRKYNDDPSHYYANPVIGFPVSQEPVKTEIAQIRAVNSEYINFFYGQDGDNPKKLAAYRAALKKAGIDKVMAEFQKQYDAWWAKNN
jgi:putative aldouronate transport system substrate-binding protein